MARIRSIKPDYWRSESITRLSRSARLTFIALWSYVDDNGVGLDNEKLIVAEIMPLEEDMIEARAIVARDLDELAREARIVRYTVAGKAYLFITGWDEHQKIDRPNKPRHPRPEAADDAASSANATGASTDDETARNPRDSASTGAEEQRNRGTGESSSPAAEPAGDPPDDEQPPSQAKAGKNRRGTRIPDDFDVTPQMVAWCRETCPAVDGRSETANFLDYWRSKPGKDGTKLDWIATWRTWMRNAQSRARPLRAVPGGPFQNPDSTDGFHGAI